MIKTILLYTNVVVLVQSVVLLVEILVNVKRPGPLKVIFLLCVLALLFRTYGQVHLDYFGYNRWIYEFSGPFFVTFSLMFFSLLYQYKFQRLTLVLLGVMLGMLFFFHVLYTFVMGYDVSISPKVIPEFKVFRWFVRVTFLLGLFAVFGNLSYKIIRKYRSINIYHRKLRRWSAVIAIHLFIIYIFGIYFTWFDAIHDEPARLLGSLVTFSLILTLIFRPKFLNNSSLKIAQGGFFNMTVVKEVSVSRFTEAFFDQLYFLNQEASLEHFSKQLEVETENLYRFVYNNYNLSFNDLLNKSRVDYFIELVNSKKFSNYTIDALAQESGFTSRHHLYKPFKKFHGGSPSDFIRSVD